MPIYAYQCSQCGYRKDVLQKLADAPLTVCPECGASAFSKQLTAPSFQLKGTGWYATDFKNSGKPAAAPASKTDSAGESAASSDASAGAANASAAPASPAAVADKT